MAIESCDYRYCNLHANNRVYMILLFIYRRSDQEEEGTIHLNNDGKVKFVPVTLFFTSESLAVLLSYMVKS